MLFRVFCLCAPIFYFWAANAHECNYNSSSSFLSRVIAIDSSDGPVYRGTKHDGSAPEAPPALELHDKEAVLIFDHGPHPIYTGYILDILDRHCAKATFFFAGSAALSHPAAVRDAARRGHTLAAGPSSSAATFATLPVDRAEGEIEKGLAAVAKASGGPVAPFFRGPPTDIPAPTLSYLRNRGISLWSADIISGDAEPGLTATQLANRTLLRIREAGKGIIEFHDTKKVTVDALDSILTGMKLSGFKLVQILPARNFAPKDEYLAAAPAKPSSAGRPASRASRMFIEDAKRQIRASKRRIRVPGTERGWVRHTSHRPQ